ncbi:hypothetical protein SAMN05421763_105316 [[Luteovulum] sphaeroides subsp. megalophilum]|uniref:hypothetical protein n=1 Tax=Cereibacter sphaeroides TaxID=1063 RepID=UPI000B6DBEE3|nr:hypothetical protein [Cereibacter sphaeroides]SNT16869.1 hypothetical protein SAMN05421763_105316 [[Luteovulum] sphaeroides subsp. megalophilum]
MNEIVRPIMRPADIRRAVAEWVAQGFAVEVLPDGTLKVSPHDGISAADAFDLVDMRR